MHVLDCASADVVFTASPTTMRHTLDITVPRILIFVVYLLFSFRMDMSLLRYVCSSHGLPTGRHQALRMVNVCFGTHGTRTKLPKSRTTADTQMRNNVGRFAVSVSEPPA